MTSETSRQHEPHVTRAEYEEYKRGIQRQLDRIEGKLDKRGDREWSFWILLAAIIGRELIPKMLGG